MDTHANQIAEDWIDMMREILQPHLNKIQHLLDSPDIDTRKLGIEMLKQDCPGNPWVVWAEWMYIDGNINFEQNLIGF